MIEGQTHSRLSELKKYGDFSDFKDKYKTSDNVNKNGIDIRSGRYIKNEKVTYYIDGITYVDDLINNTTTFSFTKTNIRQLDVVDVNYYKDPYKIKIRNNPTVKNSVKIDRQELSVFEDIYKLSYVCDMRDLIGYAGGGYFEINNNI